MSNSELPRRCLLSTRLLLAAVFAAWSCDSTPPTAPPPPPSSVPLYVANGGNTTITVYAPELSGDIPPMTTIVSHDTGLTHPYAVARDRAGRLYVTHPHSIRVFAAGATGSAAPVATIDWSNTGPGYGRGLALDTAGNMYVATLPDTIKVFAAGASGNAAPLAKIAGSNTGLLYPCGVAVDAVGRIYVANSGTYNYLETLSGFSVTVYAAGATGNATPIATIAGVSTGLSYPCGIALDRAGRIYVANQQYTNPGRGWAGENSITVFAPGATGNVVPVSKITGPTTGLSPGIGIAIDTAGRIYVANSPNTIAVYAAGATGDAVPTVTIAGSHTGLDAPQGLALDPAGGLYVVNNPEPYRDPSITVYAAGATGDATPSGTIVGGDQRPSTFAGLARDAAGRLYVTCDGTHTGWGSCISVYAPQATGNAVPVATIQGVNTSLYSPRSIAVDRAGRIYALSSQDSPPSIAVFAPGARGNVRPAWVIGGNLAGLAGGYALALDAAARIYVSNWFLNAIQIFAPGASGEAPPAAVIAGDRTGLARVKGIAVDAAGQIWVVSFDTVAYRSRILVFSPVASGNAAPAVVIEGDRTELGADPSAIAVDAGGRLYVVNGSGILVFPPGATGNAAPTRWIAGPHTGLATPVALAF